MPIILKTYSRLNLHSTSLSDPKVCLCSLCSVWRCWPLSVCHTLVLPDSHLITQAAGYQGLIWLSSYSHVFISSYQLEAAIHAHSWRRCSWWQTAPPICTDAKVSWYLRAQEELLSTALNRKSSEKFLLMECQRVPLSYVYLYIIYHQIFFCLDLSCWFEASKNKLKMNMELNRGHSIQIHWAHTLNKVFIHGFYWCDLYSLLSEHICNPAFILFESSSGFMMQRFNNSSFVSWSCMQAGMVLLDERMLLNLEICIIFIYRIIIKLLLPCKYSLWLQFLPQEYVEWLDVFLVGLFLGRI